jgi:hypothetical protein
VSKVEINNSLNRLLISSEFNNAYDLGSYLSQGVQFIFTRKLTYTSLIVGALLPYLKWSKRDKNRLASASLLAYLLDGDIQLNRFPLLDSSKGNPLPNKECSPPIATVYEDGSFILSKTPNIGLNLNQIIVKKLYQISDPNAFITPEIITDISRLIVQDLGNNQVKVSGAIGYILEEENVVF